MFFFFVFLFVFVCSWFLLFGFYLQERCLKGGVRLSGFSFFFPSLFFSAVGVGWGERGGVGEGGTLLRPLFFFL